jgi:ketosteroid isomerase-like protein
MRKVFIALAVAALAAMPTAATDRTDVMATVRQFVDGFNKGDINSAVATCADQPSIIDEFPPYEWHGAGACSNWANDYVADAKKNGITDGSVTLGKPRHIDIRGDRAYVVVPANYSFKQKGKPVREIGSMLTVALQKDGTAWRITAWAWAKR